jgi:NAD(P)-dependent dehydrogenase (short-subunit alcohol dehydrogenase family)
MSYLESMFNLKDKVVLITGGAGAIASNLAEGYLKTGAKVALLDLNKENAEKVVAKLSDIGTIKAYETNVLSEEALVKNRDSIIADFGTIDILINGAGGNMPGATISPDKTIFDLDMAQFNKVQELNLQGSILPSLVFGKVIAEKGNGSIVNMSSMTAFGAITRVAGYSASKAAITNFTKWLSVELAQKFGEGVRVNAIAPGFFIGEQNRALLTNEDGSYTARGNTIIQNTPMNRFGELNELIGATLWITSDASKFVTGVVLPVDGGFSSFSGV